MSNIIFLISALILSGPTAAQPPGPVDLMTLDAWMTPSGKPAPTGWEAVDGTLHLKAGKPRGGHLLSRVEFDGDYEIAFEWKVAQGVNGGLKYRVRWYDAGPFGRQPWGCEYQLLDNPHHSNGKEPKKRAGALYDMYAPPEDQTSRPAGEWNTARIVIRGDRLEHWLNGANVVETEVGSDDWNARIKVSKFTHAPGFASNRRGHLLLQDHGGELWIRGLTVTPVAATASSTGMEQFDTKKNVSETASAKEEAAAGDAVAEPKAPGSASAKPVQFDRDIRPILGATCIHCHGPDANHREADLRLDTPEGLASVIAAGNPAGSEFFTRITHADPELRMPPAKEARQLTPAQIDLLRRWIEQGAEWSPHWAYVTPTKPSLPTVATPAWCATPIDRFVLSGLEELGWSPTAPAVRATLLRRVTLDLTGLPPTPAEVEAFLADTRPDAFERVVDRLLASPRFGEHFAWTWLDAARYADTNGYQQDRTRTLWPWRDWVVAALNNNLPFDQFTIEQLAGDLLPNPTLDHQIATGFHRNHMLNGEGGRIAEESRVDYVVDRVETTGAVWLGMSVGCGRCHDHKYDPLSQAEFYGLYAFFNSIDEVGGVDAGGNARPVLSLPTPEQDARRAAFAAETKTLNQQLAQATAPPQQQAWEETLRSEIAAAHPTPYWHAVVPSLATSENGQTMTIESDGVVFVTGANPAKDNYTLVASTDLRQMTGIRLEALPHESFTNRGLARSDSGNFVLTEIVVESLSPDGQATRVPIASGQASFEQGGFPIKNAFDGNGTSGWAVYNPPDMTQPRKAVFVFSAPLAGGPGTRLRLRLEHQSPHASHNLGRFRLALTAEPAPSLDGTRTLPDELVAAVQTPEAKRSQEQKKVLATEFRKRAPEVKRIEAELERIKGAVSLLDKEILQTMVMRDRAEPRTTYRLIRGSWDNPDKTQAIPPSVPAAFPPLPGDLPANRLALARWLVSRQHPLTARVVVNRMWQHFFGIGLVKTAEDFGTQGERPSHPELLDWLAVDFQESGWDVKRLYRTIVCSSTYQQDSRVRPEQASDDPENRLLARGPRFRLPAHVLRDQALAVSGLLMEQAGGPPVNPYQPDGVWDDLTLGKIRFVQDHGEKIYRRTLYTFWRRLAGPSNLFDSASRQVCVVRPSRTNTPLHALTLLNDTTYVEAARVLAMRVARETGTLTGPVPLQHGFRLVTARTPGTEELAILASISDRAAARFQGDPAAAARLLAVGELPNDTTLAPVPLATLTAVMHVLLNMDEAVTKE